MAKGRVEAFSDGVVAVAITLLALDLRVPDPEGPGSLATRLGHEWPNYAAYLVSFLTVGILWVNHHALLRRLVAVNHTVLMLNLLLLAAICVLPFTTSLMAEYLKVDHGRNLAAVIYAGSVLLTGTLFFALQVYVAYSKTHLYHERLTDPVRRVIVQRNFAGLVPYAVAVGVGFFAPYATLALCAAVGVFYALPGTTRDPVDP